VTFDDDAEIALANMPFHKSFVELLSLGNIASAITKCFAIVQAECLVHVVNVLTA